MVKNSFCANGLNSEHEKNNGGNNIVDNNVIDV